MSSFTNLVATCPNYDFPPADETTSPGSILEADSRQSLDRMTMAVDLGHEPKNRIFQQLYKRFLKLQQKSAALSKADFTIIAVALSVLRQGASITLASRGL